MNINLLTCIHFNVFLFFLCRVTFIVDVNNYTTFFADSIHYRLKWKLCKFIHIEKRNQLRS